MGSQNIDFLTYLLILMNGWLMVGWPLFLITVFKYTDISKKFVAVSIGVGVGIGMGLGQFALNRSLFAFFISCIPTALIAFLVPMIALKHKESNDN